MIQETSLMAWQGINSNGELGERQQEVYNAIQRMPGRTALELAKYYFSKDANYVRPRINELYKLGLIRIGGKRKCQISKKTAFVWFCI